MLSSFILWGHLISRWKINYVLYGFKLFLLILFSFDSGDIGEVVLGPDIFALKQEVELLEKLDHLSGTDEDTLVNHNTGPNSNQSPCEYQDSPLDSNLLCSPGKDETLESRITKLSLCQTDTTSRQQAKRDLSKEKVISQSHRAVSLDTVNTEIGHGEENKVLFPSDANSSKKDSAQKNKISSPLDINNTEKGSGEENKVLSLSDVDSSVKDSCEKNQIPSPLDISNGEKGSAEENRVQSPSIVDNGSVGLESDMRQLTISDRNKAVLVDSDDDDNEISDNCSNDNKNHDITTSAKVFDVGQNLNQQLVESKTAYLMQLLSKNKDLLSKMADVQTTETSYVSPNVSVVKLKKRNDEEKEDITDLQKIVELNSGGNSDRQNVQKDIFYNNSSKEIAETPAVSVSTGSSYHQCSKSKTTSKNQGTSPLNTICKCISHWVTLDTLAFLGITSTGLQRETERTGKDALYSNPEMEGRYRELSLWLARQEKDFTELLDGEVMKKDVDEARKPLPSLEELRKQTKEFQMKAVEFFQGPVTAKQKVRKICKCK